MLFSEKKPCVTPERPEGAFRCEGRRWRRSGLRGCLPAHAAPTGGNPYSPHSRGNTFAAPAPLSPFHALRILWAQPEQRAYLRTLTEHLKEYEWL